MKEKLQDILSGNIFTKAFVRKQYKLMLLIMGLFVVYIYNGFVGQEEQKEMKQLQNDIVEANTILSDLSREYMTMTRPSFLDEQLKKSGCNVKESLFPVIYISQ